MQRDVVAVPGFWTVGETIDFLRRSHGLPDDFYDLFVVDPAHRPAGTVPTSRVLRNPRETRIRDIMDDRGLSVPATMDQEQVADIFRRNDLVTIPVVDDAQRLIGAITVDDIVDVIDEEAEEDMLGLARTGERDIFASPLRTARRRQSWLLVTLVNTILASLVISRFEGAIGQIVALAILMPIVAAMGGNAGMQVVTVMVRALAARDLTGGGTWRVVGKEIVVGADERRRLRHRHGHHRDPVVRRPGLGGGAGERHDVQHGLGRAGRNADPADAQPVWGRSGGGGGAVPDHDDGRAGLLRLPGAGERVFALAGVTGVGWNVPSSP